MNLKNEKILITGGSGFIGTNLIDLLIKYNTDFVNIDKNAPKKNKHFDFWHEINILNTKKLEFKINEYKPTILIHLAGRTDTFGKKIEDYEDNTVGTKNILNAIKNQSSINRVVITSTQYVFFPKKYSLPKSDDDYCPHTVYGESKIITEKLTKKFDLKCCWTIVRPTNVWGPWHIRYGNELLSMINKGLYFHPGKQKVIKSYAYVSNLNHQLLSIISAETSLVNKETYYLGDPPIDAYKWMNSFSKNLNGTDIKIIPRFFIKVLALFGDFLDVFNFKFPLNSVRYRNMTNDYIAPMEKTIKAFGVKSNSLDQNVKETVSWLKKEGSSFVKSKY